MTRIQLVSLFAGFCLVLLSFAGPAAAQGADDPAEVEAGQVVFEANCASCHSADGTGSQTGRPLTDVATEADRSVHIESVTNGKGGMPAFGERLITDEISAAVSYVRLSFVSQAAEPAPEPEPAEEPELARTGVETPVLLVAGGLLLTLGVAFRRSAARI